MEFQKQNTIKQKRKWLFVGALNSHGDVSQIHIFTLLNLSKIR